MNVWSELRSGNMSYTHAIARLAEARDNGIRITSRSLELLSIESDEQKIGYIQGKLCLYILSGLLSWVCLRSCLCVYRGV